MFIQESFDQFYFTLGGFVLNINLSCCEFFFLTLCSGLNFTDIPFEIFLVLLQLLEGRIQVSPVMRK